jgi:hypothetical protein
MINIFFSFLCIILHSKKAFLNRKETFIFSPFLWKTSNMAASVNRNGFGVKTTPIWIIFLFISLFLNIFLPSPNVYKISIIIAYIALRRTCWKRTRVCVCVKEKNVDHAGQKNDGGCWLAGWLAGCWRERSQRACTFQQGYTHTHTHPHHGRNVAR